MHTHTWLFLLSAALLLLAGCPEKGDDDDDDDTADDDDDTAGDDDAGDDDTGDDDTGDDDTGDDDTGDDDTAQEPCCVAFDGYENQHLEYCTAPPVWGLPTDADHAGLVLGKGTVIYAGALVTEDDISSLTFLVSSESPGTYTNTQVTFFDEFGGELFTNTGTVTLDNTPLVGERLTGSFDAETVFMGMRRGTAGYHLTGTICAVRQY